MQFEIGEQFALRLGELFRPAEKFHTQTRGGRAQRIALAGDVLHLHQPVAAKRPQNRERAGEF